MQCSESPTTNKIWCSRCHKWHLDLPVDPDKLLADLSEQIAQDIDASILMELLGK